MVVLNFSGSGGLYHYYFGICACLQDETDVSSLRFKTTSGSCFPVMLLCMGLPVRSGYRRWVSWSVGLFNRYRIFNSCEWISLYYKMVYRYCYEVGKVSETARWNHTITATKPNGKTCEISSYSCIEDYAHVATASAYIPLPWCRPFWNVKTRNIDLFDGSMGCRTKQPSGLEILVSTTSLSGTRAYGGLFYKWYYTLAGLVNDCEWMYDAGYSDAKRFLLPQLNIPCAPKFQVSSTDEHNGLNSLRLYYDSSDYL